MGDDIEPNSEAQRPAEECAGGTPAPEPFKLPRSIRHYKVIRELGQGGMGRVIKCLDTTLNRYVALKMLHPHLSVDIDFIERFKKEALAVAKLRHPNIVQIYSIDQVDDIVFYTMEYVEGEGLDCLLSRRGRLDEKEAVRIVTQAAEGLENVHSSGILHRDLKPSNLLLDSSGRVMISDFGLAKIDYMQSHKISRYFSGADRSAVRGPGETDPETIVGTPYYISPECLRGREPDFRSDIYSLGIVFYETLAGRLPFQGETPSAIFRGHLSEMPPPIAELAPETSLKVAGIAYRCMEKDASLRYQTCEGLLRDLRDVSAGWRMSKEIEERKKLSIDMARAMIPEKRSASSSRALGRIIALLIVLALLGALLLLSADLFKSIPRGLPPGSWQDDAAFAPGRPARVAGRILSVERSDGYATVAISRDFEAGQPVSSARIPEKALERPEAPRIEPGTAIFLEGMVVAGESPILRVPGATYAWNPLLFTARVMEDGSYKPADPARMRAAAGTPMVRIRGNVLARSDKPDGETVILMGETTEGGLLCAVVPVKTRDFDGRDIRIGDVVTFEGRNRGEDRDGIVVIGEAVVAEHVARISSRE